MKLILPTIAVATAMATPCHLHASEETKRPNILLCIADDWGWPDAGAYGARWVKTPHFDRLAEQGVIFENAFTNSPSCTPSRGVILTGRLPWRLGESSTLWGHLPADIPAYPEILARHGYKVGFTGKGWSPGSVEAGGRTENPAGPEFNEATLAKLPTSEINPVDYAENFRRFLAGRKGTEPFCFWYGAFEPHRLYEEGSGKRLGKVRVDDVPRYGFYPESDEIRSDFLDYSFEVSHMDDHLGQMIAHLEAIGELENTIIVVTGDHGMPFPRMKAQLYERGIHVPLVIHWGEKVPGGRRVEDLVTFIDIAPTLLDLAGVPPPPNSDFDGRSLKSLLESESSTDPQAPKYALFGIERHGPVPRNEELTGKRGAGYPMRAIRDSRFLLIKNEHPDWFLGSSDRGPTRDVIMGMAEGPPEDRAFYELSFGQRPAYELYDAVNDPDCVNNLVDEPAHQGTFDRLKAALASAKQETGDPRAGGRPDRFFGNPFHKFGPDRFPGWE